MNDDNNMIMIVMLMVMILKLTRLLMTMMPYILFTLFTIESNDVIQVFTMRLIEGIGLGYPQAKLLELEEFPTGIMFHHNKKYMAKLMNHEIKPYHFHM